MQQWRVRREFLRRLKQTFDAQGIEIPYPRLTIYPGQAKDGSAPPLHLVVEPGSAHPGETGRAAAASASNPNGR